MRRGRREKPVISIASIEAALKGFGYGYRERPEAATLEALALVDLQLAQASRPSAENLRSYMVQTILAELLEVGLNEQRRLFDLSPVSLQASRKEAEEQINEILTKDSFSLKAWACLYYRYLRADLAFTVEELSQALGFSPRNFPRHEADGLRLLRDKLISSEWQARKLLLRRVLQRNIPEALVPLIGREKASESAQWALQQNPPIPILITGAEGIGKSALAAQIAQHLIETDALDYLVWISRPKHLEEIYNALEDALLPYPSRVDWRALLGSDTLLLVLDDVSQLRISREEWETLSGLIAPSYLLITNREYQPLLKLLLPLPLAELNPQQAETLIATYLPNKDLLYKIPVEELGGNPSILAYAAQLALAGYRPQKAFSDLQAVYDKAFAELSENSRMAWLANAVGLVIHDDSLIARSLPNPSAKNYIIQRYSRDTTLQVSFQEYLGASSFPLSLLSLDWLKLETHFVLDYLQSYETKTNAELRQWLKLATPYLKQSSTKLQLKYGTALRRLQQAEAEAYLLRLIEIFGQVGDFKGQAQARYELALLYQSQSQFEKALAHYNAVEAYKQLDVTLQANIYLQYARLAIEQGNGHLALDYLQARSNQQAEDQVLVAEAYLLIGEIEQSQNCAKTALAQLADNPQLAASLHTILGRGSQAESALDHLNAALSLAEQYNSDFDIARAKSNLASAYLAYPNYFQEAEALLRQAIDIQTRIHDHLGLNASNLNFNYLQRSRLSYRDSGNDE